MGGRQRDRLPGEGRVGGLCVPCLFLRGGLVVAHGGGGGCSGEQEIGKMEVAVDDVGRQVEARLICDFFLPPPPALNQACPRPLQTRAGETPSTDPKIHHSQSTTRSCTTRNSALYAQRLRRFVSSSGTSPPAFLPDSFCPIFSPCFHPKIHSSPRCNIETRTRRRLSRNISSACIHTTRSKTAPKRLSDVYV